VAPDSFPINSGRNPWETIVKKTSIVAALAVAVFAMSFAVPSYAGDKKKSTKNHAKADYAQSAPSQRGGSGCVPGGSMSREARAKYNIARC
jgi:hypothetical protein